MCVSAMIEEDLRRLEREYEAVIDWTAWGEFFQLRTLYDLKLPKALEANFDEPKTPDEVRIKRAIDEYRAKKSAALEQELFKQKKRLGDAERGLKVKTTKKALEDQRIATNKIDDLVRRINDLKRTELLPRDSIMFPFHHVPLIVGGQQRKIVPGRYHCRLPGTPAFFDKKYPGLYNARRDSLEGFWKKLFGKQHALIRIYEFWENVSRHHYERRELRPGEAEANVVVHFKPQPPRPMHIACMWSRLETSNEPNTVTFAGITDDPTPEIAAAGHDRALVMLRREDVDTWLKSDADVSTLYRLFDARERPLFEHRIAA